MVLPAARLRHSPAASGVRPLLLMMFIVEDLQFATLLPSPPSSCRCGRGPAIGSRSRRTTLYCRPTPPQWLKNPMGLGSPGQSGRSVAVEKTCARRFLRKRPCRRLQRRFSEHSCAQVTSGKPACVRALDANTCQSATSRRGERTSFQSISDWGELPGGPGQSGQTE